MLITEAWVHFFNNAFVYFVRSVVVLILLFYQTNVKSSNFSKNSISIDWKC